MKHKFLLMIAVILIIGTIMLPSAMIQAHAVTMSTKCIIQENQYDADEAKAYRTSSDGLDSYFKVSAKLPKIKREPIVKVTNTIDSRVKTPCQFTLEDFKKERAGNTYTTKYDNNGEDDSAPINIY